MIRITCIITDTPENEINPDKSRISLSKGIVVYDIAAAPPLISSIQPTIALTTAFLSIKEMAVHDGPGIRTTVFLKGCPLRCKWCHNPEGFLRVPQLMYKEQQCVHCGKCYEKCGHKDCKIFGRCIHICPENCLEVTGREVGVKELAKELKMSADILGLKRLSAKTNNCYFYVRNILF